MQQNAKKSAVRNVIAELPQYFMKPKKKVFHSALSVPDRLGEVATGNGLMALLPTKEKPKFERDKMEIAMPVLWAYCHLEKRK